MPKKSQEVDYAHANTQMRGYLAFDDSPSAKRPAVLICHEWWGLNDYIRRRADQITALGYVAMALDMYGQGKTTSTPDEAGKLMNSLLSNPDAIGRVKAALATLQQQPMVDATKIAAIGYCMGGSMALHMARAALPLAGVVCFHGSLKAKQPAQAGTIKARLLVCTGSDDPLVPMEEVLAFNQEMRQAQADYQINMYGRAKHAFTNPNADNAGLPPLKYSPTADARSWEAMKLFLHEVLA
jgi:dienelactone hydrolase